MFNLKYLLVLVALIVVTISAAPALAQTTAPVRGVVKLRAADGTETAVAGATIESYQTDMGKGVGLTTTTNKRGEFTFAGFQFGHVYALAVSGPGLAPLVQPNIKAGTDNIAIIVSAGDGRKATEDEVRKFVAGGAQQSTASAKEQSKEQEEYQKKVAQYNEAKKKAEDANKVVNAALKDGIAAFQAKNYELAAQKFDEGYQADPDFEGSAPIMIRNKGVALREWGISMVRDAANGDAAAKAAALEKAKANFIQADAAFQRSIEILDKAPADADANNMKQARLDTYREWVVLDGVMAKLQVDPEKSKGATAHVEKYLPLETDEARKQSTLITWANYMREAGLTSNAIYAYRIVMEKASDNLDVIAGLGLSLFAEGVSAVPENKEQEQEGLNLMQKFADTAPDTHPLKSSVKEAVDYLKNTAKLAPQKVAPGKKKP